MFFYSGPTARDNKVMKQVMAAGTLAQPGVIRITVFV